MKNKIGKSAGYRGAPGYPQSMTYDISCFVGSEDFKMFQRVINQGIDSHLEGFTKSSFKIVGDRLCMAFDSAELPILLRRLDEIGGDHAQGWREDIQTR